MLIQLEKFLGRTKYLGELIEKEFTGTPKELARKLGISERMVYRYIETLNEQGSRIKFDRIKNTYRFLRD